MTRTHLTSKNPMLQHLSHKPDQESITAPCGKSEAAEGGPRVDSTCVATVLALAIILGIAGCTTTSEPPPTQDPAPETVDIPAPPIDLAIPRVMGYHVYWTNDAWQNYPFDVLDAVLFFDLEVGADGHFTNRHGWPDRWLPMQRYATERETQVIPVISLMNPDAFAELFQSSGAQETLENEILDLFVDNPGIAGVQLDFEVFVPMPDGVRDAVTRFVRSLDERMEEDVPGRSLSMFLLAYDNADVLDEVALSEVLDFLVVQGYDLHARADEQAGPVAAAEGWGRRSWEFIVDRYRQLGVPDEKIVMSVPYFGYEWPTVSDSVRSRTRGPGRSLTLAPVDSAHGGANRVSGRLRAAEHGPQRDSLSQVPYYVYSDTSGTWQGWFEDEHSLAAKYRFVQNRGLRGVAIFPLAYGDDETHQTLRGAFGRTIVPASSQ